MKILRPLVTALLLLLPALLHAQRPLGDPFLVNLERKHYQEFPRVAANAAGEFVVTWWAYNQGDGGPSIFARRYSADGRPSTGEILVTRRAYFSTLDGAVAIMADGSFVVIFGEDQAAPPAIVKARWYLPEGTVQDTRVVTAAGASNLSIATRGDGGFAVAWTGNSQAAIRARAFGSDHTPLGPEVTVDRLYGFDPSVAMDPTGDFVVAFQARVLGDPDDPEDERFFVAARSFAANGSPLGRSFAVSPKYTRTSLYIKAGKDEDGNSIVAWSGEGESLLRRFRPDGSPLGKVLHLPAAILTVGLRGNYVLAWSEPGVPRPRDTRVFAQRFSKDGSPLGRKVPVTTGARGKHWAADVAIGAEGGFIVTWLSEPEGRPASSFDVFARRFRRR
jgi:hypothetical protein